MSPTRRFTMGTKICFAAFALLLLLMFAAMAVFARTTVLHQPAAHTLDAGTVLYDNTFMPVELPDG